MRLLMVADTALTHTRRWAAFCRDAGLEVSVVSHTPEPIDGVRVERFPPAGAWWRMLPRRHLGGGWPRWLAGWPCWRRILRDVRPDIVHVHFVRDQARQHFYYRPVPHLVVTAYGSDVVFASAPARRTARRIRALLAQASAVTAASRFLAERTAAFLPPGRDVGDVEVVPFGVDVERFRPSSGPPGDGAPALGFAKHLEPIYGPDVLLEAFALVRRRRPQARLVVAGSGSLEAVLRRRAAAPDLAGAVDLVGRLEHDEVAKLLPSLDLFVMPSVCEEAFGVAALEAAACAVPVVASRVGGVPEAVVDGETGVLVPPADPAVLAEACLDLLGRPDERARLGAAGRRRVIERFDWSVTAGRMLELYRELVAGDPTGSRRR